MMLFGTFKGTSAIFGGSISKISIGSYMASYRKKAGFVLSIDT